MSQQNNIPRLKIVIIAIVVLTVSLSCLFLPGGPAPKPPAGEAVSPTSPSPSATKTAPPIEIIPLGDNGVRRVAKSLNFIMTRDTSLPSYHLESTQLAPCWAKGGIAQCPQEMRADVQGKDVHFTYNETLPSGATKITEAYLINDQEYDVVDGKVQAPGPGLNSIAWSMWPANTLLIIAIGDTNVSPGGTEVLEARTTELYTLDGTGSSITNATGVQLSVTSAAGKVWVDQTTGALLKAVIDFQADVRDTAGQKQGSGAGHLEIRITNIDKVTVALPK